MRWRRATWRGIDASMVDLERGVRSRHYRAEAGIGIELASLADDRLAHPPICAAPRTSAGSMLEDANLAESISATEQADQAHRAALSALSTAGRLSLMDDPNYEHLARAVVRAFDPGADRIRRLRRPAAGRAHVSDRCTRLRTVPPVRAALVRGFRTAAVPAVDRRAAGVVSRDRSPSSASDPIARCSAPSIAFGSASPLTHPCCGSPSSLPAAKTDERPTVNLRAPIVINPQTMVGYQLMPSNSLYPLRHPLGGE